MLNFIIKLISLWVDNIENIIKITFTIIGILGGLFLILLEIVGIYSLIFHDEKIGGIICVITPIIFLIWFTREGWEHKLNLWNSKIWLRRKNKNGWNNDELLYVYDFLINFNKEINSEVNYKDWSLDVLTLPERSLSILKISEHSIHKLVENRRLLKNNSLNYDKITQKLTLDKKTSFIKLLWVFYTKSLEINTNMNKSKSEEFLLKMIRKIDPNNQTEQGIENDNS